MLFDGARLAALAKVDVETLLALARPANRRALLQLSGRWWTTRPWLSVDARRELVDSWMPNRAAHTHNWRSKTLDAAERELVMLRLDRYEHKARADRSLVDDLCALLGIPAKGLRYDGALVVERDDTGLIFAVEGKNGPRLRVPVSPANEDPAESPRRGDRRRRPPGPRDRVVSAPPRPRAARRRGRRHRHLGGRRLAPAEHPPEPADDRLRDRAGADARAVLAAPQGARSLGRLTLPRKPPSADLTLCHAPPASRSPSLSFAERGVGWFVPFGRFCGPPGGHGTFMRRGSRARRCW